jgi:hypothetical protein
MCSLPLEGIPHTHIHTHQVRCSPYLSSLTSHRQSLKSLVDPYGSISRLVGVLSTCFLYPPSLSKTCLGASCAALRSLVVRIDVFGCRWYLEGAFPDRSARQATRAAWRQSQCVSSGTAGSGSRAVSALSGSVSSSSSLSSLGPARPTATGPITPDTSK